MNKGSIATLTFGENKIYDRKCIQIFNYDNDHTKTIERIQGSINNYKLMLNHNKGKYDSECIEGEIKWSDKIRNIINYYTALLEYFSKCV